VKRALLDLLVDPIRREPLSLEASEAEGDTIRDGALRAADGTAYPIRSGIPRFVITEDADQLQTRDAFGFKWGKRDSYGSPGMRSMLISWALERFGCDSVADWAGFYAGRKRILDVGCGGALSASLFLDSDHWSGKAMWVGVDISSAIDVAQDNVARFANTHFVQADALQLPFPDASFDTIVSEGVLHHTPSTREALLSAARVLETGGEFQFYVYRRKGPVREFTDDYVRSAIADFSDEDAWAAMRSMTRLGQALSELNVSVNVPEDVPLLGIAAGEYDVQRLVYWHFAKLYWNPLFSFEENVHVNFDWYRPRYAHRQTADEVRQWCTEAGLTITWFLEQESGFTVRATKA